MKIVVKHYRLVDGVPMANSIIRMNRLKVDSKGGFTVAVAYDESGNAVAQAKAECSQLDNFNKRLGRAIATGRLAAQLDGRTQLREERRAGTGQR